MSTRGFIGVVAGGQLKITYNHWDSYPSGLGLEVLHWIRDSAVNYMGVVLERARALRVVPKASRPTSRDIEFLAKYADKSVSSHDISEWYVLLRKTQGNLGMTLEAGVIIDGSDFPADSLFAEYGYIIDFDTMAFEAYRGFQYEPHSAGRFSSMPSVRHRPGGADYYPCRLIASWPLNSLPSDDAFIAAFNAYEEERNEPDGI